MIPAAPADQARPLARWQAFPARAFPAGAARAGKVLYAIWQAWADDVRGHGIDSGHHMAEEAPKALPAALGDFFSPRHDDGEQEAR
jgi:hypothetical protein